jgi:hypothetical protein
MNLSAGKSKPSCFSRSATESWPPFAILRSLVKLGTEAKEVEKGFDVVAEKQQTI